MVIGSINTFEFKLLLGQQCWLEGTTTTTSTTTTTTLADEEDNFVAKRDSMVASDSMEADDE